MNCTISTDASFSKLYEVGAYAFWITSNIGPIRKSGILRKNVSSSTEAEMKCIINALTFLHRHEELNSKVKVIFLNTDSMNAIHLFTGDKKAMARYRLREGRYMRLQTRYNEIKQLLNKEIHIRHIKAHEHTESPRNFVNDWCDNAAKEQMGKKLKEFVIKKP